MLQPSSMDTSKKNLKKIYLKMEQKNFSNPFTIYKQKYQPQIKRLSQSLSSLRDIQDGLEIPYKPAVTQQYLEVKGA